MTAPGNGPSVPKCWHHAGMQALPALPPLTEEMPPWRLYLDLRGRISRRRLWLHGVLALFVVGLVGMALLEIAGTRPERAVLSPAPSKPSPDPVVPSVHARSRPPRGPPQPTAQHLPAERSRFACQRDERGPERVLGVRVVVEHPPTGGPNRTAVSDDQRGERFLVPGLRERAQQVGVGPGDDPAQSGQVPDVVRESAGYLFARAPAPKVRSFPLYPTLAPRTGTAIRVISARRQKEAAGGTHGDPRRVRAGTAECVSARAL